MIPSRVMRCFSLESEPSDVVVDIGFCLSVYLAARLFSVACLVLGKGTETTVDVSGPFLTCAATALVVISRVRLGQNHYVAIDFC
jgi:hypothetical protein